MIIGLSLSIYAYLKVKLIYNKYIVIPNSKNITGINVAKSLLNKYGIPEVQVEIVGGNLTDKYDTKNNIVKLSNSVYSNSSITALGIAAHEVGHAIQHKEGYRCLKIANIVAFYSSIISNFSHVIIILGLLLKVIFLFKFGVIVFGSIVLINIFTLPVELNASKRGKSLVIETFDPSREELSAIHEVLFAASLNYSATMVIGIGSIAVVIKRRLISIMRVLK